MIWQKINSPYLTQLSRGYSFPRFSMSCSCWNLITIKISYKLPPLISRIWIWCILRYKFRNFYLSMILTRFHFIMIVVCKHNCIILITRHFCSFLFLVTQILPCVRTSFSELYTLNCSLGIIHIVDCIAHFLSKVTTLLPLFSSHRQIHL